MLPELEKVKFHIDTLIGWHFLPAEEKEYVVTTLQKLAEMPPEQWPKDVARPVAMPEPRYVLYALGKKLFIIFRRDEDGSLTVLDMIHRETVERYGPLAGANGAVT